MCTSSLLVFQMKCAVVHCVILKAKKAEITVQVVSRGRSQSVSLSDSFIVDSFYSL